MKKMVILLLLIACTYDPYAVRYVIDGDTFVLNNGQTIRLEGIDTPEKGDLNYDKAAYELQRRIIGRQLKLEGEEVDNYGRLVRHVFADGRHVNLEMVQEGWARAFMHTGKYEALLEKAQQDAMAAKKGIWKFDDRSYQRLSARCPELGCPLGTIAVASKYGDVFYNCACGETFRIGKGNIICFGTIQEAIAQGLREAKRC